MTIDASDVPFDDDGDAVDAVWTSAHGGEIICRVLIDEGMDQLEAVSGTHADHRVAVIHVQTSIVSAPAVHDAVTIDDGDHAGTWRVTRRISQALGIASVSVQRDTLARAAAAQAVPVPR
jgi:hypothetical protein